MKFKTLDLIDFKQVDILLEGFNKSTGFVTAILDLDGNILSQSGWRQICTEFHRVNPKTSKNCTISDTVLAGEMADGEQYHFYKCLNGLVDVAVPIVIQGEHIANLFSGQFFFEEPDRMFFKEQAQRYHFDDKKYMEALDKVPVVSKEKVKTAMDFLLDMTQLISETLFQKMEQMELHDAVLKSEERFRELFENAPFPYQILDEAGCILEANRRLLEHLGYSRDEVIGKMFGDFLHPDWQDHFRENFPKFKSVGEVLGLEFQLRKKDGTHIWVSFDGKINRTLAGNFIQTHCIFTDISEQKRLQNKVRQQQEALSQSQKLESVGRLAGGVAHDFNNMLSIILGYTDLALEKLDPSDPLYDDMEEINQAGVRSAELTRQLLAFARQQTVAPKVLNLNDNIGSMIKMLRQLIGEDIDFAWIPGTKLSSVKIDPSQIDQILANLCVNARDAITDIGKVTIETKNIGFDKDYCASHTEFLPGEYVMLAVSDDGCGISSEDVTQIFEPFFTTKKTGQGTGLGLATVYGIVKQNNGFINVYSEPEKGTTIRIYLPRYAEEAVEVRNEYVLKIPQSQGETILLVEDDASILKLGKRILENLGYKVLSTTRSKEAKKMAEDYDGQINLLLTDVVMPQMNGRELSEQLQSLYPQLKILFMSGYTANVIAHRGVLDEGIKFISKPFSPKDIALKIREVLD